VSSIGVLAVVGQNRSVTGVKVVCGRTPTAFQRREELPAPLRDYGIAAAIGHLDGSSEADEAAGVGERGGGSDAPTRARRLGEDFSLPLVGRSVGAVTGHERSERPAHVVRHGAG
jgi:hypothetical protein